MKNKIIESAIEQVIDQTDYGVDFKNVFKRFIKNKFDNNASDGDLKRVIECIKEVGEDKSDEDVYH